MALNSWSINFVLYEQIYTFHLYDNYIDHIIIFLFHNY